MQIKKMKDMPSTIEFVSGWSIVSTIIFSLAALLAAFSPLPASVVFGFGGVFAVFMIPGSHLAFIFSNKIDVTYLFMSFFCSYVVYSVVAEFCRVFEFEYYVFYVMFFICIIGQVIFSFFCRKNVLLSGGYVGVVVIVFVAIALSSIFFQYPWSNDQGLFNFNVYSSAYFRNFVPSSADSAVFGVNSTQPRMAANLYHAFFALLSVSIGINPSVSLMHLANPFVGFFFFMSITSLHWELSGRSVSPIYFLFGCVAIFVFLDIGHSSVYWYAFRFLNSPALDKDFSLFILLPAFALCVSMFHSTEQRRWIWLMLASLPAMIYSHPVTCTYLVITWLCFAIYQIRMGKIKYIAASGFVTFVGFIVGFLVINPADTHLYIDMLVKRDMALWAPKLHYWGGHYVVPNLTEYSSVVNTTVPGVMNIRNIFVFGDPFVKFSSIAAMFWCATLAFGGGGSVLRETYWKLVLSCLAVSILVWVMSKAENPLSLALLGWCLIASVIVICVILWLNLKEGARIIIRPSQFDALKLQAVYFSVSLLLFVATSVSVTVHPELFRGLERLHWFHFVGMVAVPYLVANSLSLITKFGGDISGHDLKRLGPAFVGGVLVLACADQLNAIASHSKTVMGRMAIASPYVDHIAYPREKKSQSLSQLLSKERSITWLPPAWLQETDRILSANSSRHPKQGGDFVLFRQYVYYRELYSEAFAYQHLGERFLAWQNAYNDFIDGKITDRVVNLIREQNVTILVAGNNIDLEKSIMERWPSAQEIDENIYRLPLEVP